jgi:hypothetical protein
MAARQMENNYVSVFDDFFAAVLPRNLAQHTRVVNVVVACSQIDALHVA